jgi:hypothetical protein
MRFSGEIHRRSPGQAQYADFPPCVLKRKGGLLRTKTGVGAKERNELYVARDLAVYEREFPGLTEEKAMQTDDRREYEAYFTVQALRDAAGDRPLEAIIREGLTDAQHQPR